MKLLRTTAGALLLPLLSVPAFAWGQEGHSIVAEIAQRRLSPQAAAAVEQLLGRGHSLASVANWADDFRSTEQGKPTQNWHFVDIPLAQKDYDATRDCKLDPGKGDCIVAELRRLKDAELLCPTGDKQKDEPGVTALKFAVHFIGDIHQPLHTVDELTGGNDYEVGINMQGATCRIQKCTDDVMCRTPRCNPAAVTNLHVMWDSTLIQRRYWNWGAYVDALEEGWLRSPEAQSVDGGTPEDWAVETHGEAQSAWSKAQAKTVLDDAYLNDDEIKSILDRQLAVAGLRLARFLNEAYVSCPRP